MIRVLPFLDIYTHAPTHPRSHAPTHTPHTQVARALLLSEAPLQTASLLTNLAPEESAKLVAKYGAVLDSPTNDNAGRAHQSVLRTRTRQPPKHTTEAYRMVIRCERDRCTFGSSTHRMTLNPCSTLSLLLRTGAAHGVGGRQEQTADLGPDAAGGTSTRPAASDGALDAAGGMATPHAVASSGEISSFFQSLDMR